MNEYYFNYHHGKTDKPSVVLFFTFLLSFTALLLSWVFANGLLAVFSIFIAVGSFKYLIKRMHKKIRQTEHIITNEDDFSCSKYKQLAYKDIVHIHVPIKEIGALGSDIYERYKRSDIELPYLTFTITMLSGEKLTWTLNEWGGLYNSKKDFEIFFAFLAQITLKIHELHTVEDNEIRYLKILDQNGDWNIKPVK